MDSVINGVKSAIDNQRITQLTEMNFSQIYNMLNLSVLSV